MINITADNLYMLKKWLHYKYKETVSFSINTLPNTKWVSGKNEKGIHMIIIDTSDGSIEVWDRAKFEFIATPSISDKTFYQVGRFNK